MRRRGRARPGGVNAQAIPVRGSATGRKIDGVGYLFVAFFAVPFLIFNIMPVIFGAYVAFTQWSIIGTPNWVGLDNFREAFGDEWARAAPTRLRTLRGSCRGRPSSATR